MLVLLLFHIQTAVSEEVVRFFLSRREVDPFEILNGNFACYLIFTANPRRSVMLGFFFVCLFVF